MYLPLFFLDWEERNDGCERWFELERELVMNDVRISFW